MTKRAELRQKLVKLPCDQFDELLDYLSPPPPPGNIPPFPAALNQRVDKLLEWVSWTDPSLVDLENAYKKLCKAHKIPHQGKERRLKWTIVGSIFASTILPIVLLKESTSFIRIAHHITQDSSGSNNSQTRASNRFGLVNETWYLWKDINPDEFSFSKDKHVFSSQEGLTDLYVCGAQHGSNGYKVGKTFLGNCNIASYREPIPDEKVPEESYFRPSEDRKEVLVPFRNSQVLTINSQLVEYDWVSIDIDYLSNGKLLDKLSEYQYRFSKDREELVICKVFFKDAWHPGILDGEDDKYFCAFPHGSFVGWVPNEDTKNKVKPYDEPDKRRVEFLVIRLLDRK